MADNNHYNVDAMNAEEKRRKVIVSASAVLILLLAIIQMHLSSFCRFLIIGLMTHLVWFSG